jgi:hypothetical protein
MQKLIKFFTSAVVCTVLITLPGLINGNSKKDVNVKTGKVISIASDASMTFEAQASSLYDALAMNGDISIKTLTYALKGFKYLQSQGLLQNNILSICDFSQSSRKKRLYIIDVANRKLLMNTYVAHGRNSGAEYATSFSNDQDSHKSSLGFYVTSNTYRGAHGLSLRIDGIEKGFNDKANSRDVVVHGCAYLGDQYLRSAFAGRSWGCPAVPLEETPKVIELIKNHSCLFIYHPTEKYLKNSKIINADIVG